MNKPKFYNTAYPGSMSEREDGDYVERTDSETLATALLGNLYAAQLEMKDWRDTAIDLEKQLAAKQAKIGTLLEALEAMMPERTGYAQSMDWDKYDAAWLKGAATIKQAKGEEQCSTKSDVKASHF